MNIQDLVILQWKPMVKFRFFSNLRNTQGQHLTLEPCLGIHSEYSCPVIGCRLLHWDSRRSEDTRNGHHDPFHPHLCLNFPSKLVGPPWFFSGKSTFIFIGLKSTFRVQIQAVQLANATGIYRSTLADALLRRQRKVPIEAYQEGANGDQNLQRWGELLVGGLEHLEHFPLYMGCHPSH